MFIKTLIVRSKMGRDGSYGLDVWGVGSSGLRKFLMVVLIGWGGCRSLRSIEAGVEAIFGVMKTLEPKGRRVGRFVEATLLGSEPAGERWLRWDFRGDRDGSPYDSE